MSDSAAPVGVFDSGVGGLSVLRALWELLPRERFYYVADSINCPYSDRSPAEIQALSLGIGEHLCEMGAKAIVVACNTASAGALPALRERLAPVPVIGMVPALKTAVGLSKSRAVGVLATSATLGGYLYRDVQERFASDANIIALACPGLVERIEAGKIDTPDTENLLRNCLAPVVEAAADVLVLGCTHYPFVIPLLRRILGPDVLFLEPSQAVARQTGRVLAEHGLAADGEAPLARGTVFGTTGDPSEFRRMLRLLLGVDGDVLQLGWDRGRLVNGITGAAG